MWKNFDYVHLQLFLVFHSFLPRIEVWLTWLVNLEVGKWACMVILLLSIFWYPSGNKKFPHIICMIYAQWQNHLMMPFSECIPFVKQYNTVYKKRYKVLLCKIMETEKYHDLPSINLRARKAGCIVWRPEKQRVSGVDFSMPLKTWESGTLKRKDWCPSWSSQAESDSPTSFILLCLPTL
jgi:hypothetical protein